MLIDAGILALRLLLGAAIAAHGAQKLFGSFGGYGLKGTGGFFEGLGFRPGVPFAAAAGLSEFGGGILLALGLLTPVGAAAVLSTMVVAMISVHVKNGFWGTNNGIEMPFLYAAAAIGIGLMGPGAFSLDALFRLTIFSQSGIIIGLLILSVVGAFVTLAIRRPPRAQQPSAQNAAA
jgi:putative oxidoreductase